MRYIRNKYWCLVKKLLVLLVIGALLLSLPRTLLRFYSSKRAQSILFASDQDVSRQPLEKKLIVLTSWVNKQYLNKRESDLRPIESNFIYYLSLYTPYLTSRHLPTLFQIPPGAIELLSADVEGIGKGLCDSAARMLLSLLEGAGYHAKQVNIYKPNSGHTAVEVILDAPHTKKVFIDPYFGLVAKNKSELIGIAELKSLLKRNTVESLFVRLNEKSNVDFYRNFSEAHFGYQGEGEVRTFLLPTVTEVMQRKKTFSPYLYYIGTRYDSTWIRQLKVYEDITLTFIFDGPVNEKILNSNLQYTIKENTLSWHIKKGEFLKLYDNRTSFSILSRNRFQVVKDIKISHGFNH